MITYTHISLFGLGILGVLLHNLVELNKLNKASAGKFNVSQYFKLERFSIAVSIIVCLVAVFVSNEITQIELASKWIGLAFMAIGYMGQSLLISIMGKANKIVNVENNVPPADKDVTIN